MALVIYDQGYRIQTPVRALFKPGGVNSLEPIKALHPAAGEEQRIETEAERFRLQGAGLAGKKHPQQPAQRAYAASEKAAEQPGAPQLLAAQIMTSPVQHISPETTIRDAQARMRRLNIQHLVVISTEQRPLALLNALDLDQSTLPPQSPVAVIHGRHLLAASPTTDASHLAASFVEFDLNAIPIVDADDTLVGIVTRTDLLRLLITGAHIERWA
ncbi:CBS domain-containing protein [Marinobacterium rhizophilum]|uniref:CBS domain-containing protein n=1 Tax=Marinobacterium rhizophilum TaxID=420402 RepID=A0ABY5HCB5_9GAMM|nr:CBS domain-containing protein [Marinobacterium rhizophilum]UTW10003.1 CBS domain-containing protein [Marinobacterium rhizophilum]